jgi:hypothetical protein
MKIVVYWEHSDEESAAKKAARYLLSLFRKRGMPKAEILVRSVGAGLADEAQRLADQMEAAFGEGNSPGFMETFEDELRQVAAQTQVPTIVFGDPLRDRSGWTLSDVNALRSAPNPALPGGPYPMGVLPQPPERRIPEPVYLQEQLRHASIFGMISETADPATLKATLEVNGFHDVGRVDDDGIQMKPSTP